MRNQQNMPAASDQTAQNQARTDDLGDTNQTQARSHDVLGRLRNRGVFYVEPRPDGTFEFTEACDHYFSEILSAEEVRELGQELLDMAPLPLPTP